MTQQNDAFWLLAQRRMASLRPDVAAAILRAFRILRDALDDNELAELIAAGAIEQIMQGIFTDALLNRAMLPVRQRLRQTLERSFRYTTADLPTAGKIDGTIAVAFDHLNPDVITAIRTLETSALDTLKGDVKETTRAFLENALREGTAPKVVARELRGVIGLAPNQERAVANFERMLRAGDREALTRALRDRRFDATVKRAFGADGSGLSESQVSSMTAAYRRRFLAFNADVNAKTGTFDAYKLGQRLTWQSAIDAGVVDGDRLVKTWVHLDEQPHPRPEHAAMQGETVPHDEPYSNGQMIAGFGDFGCHCQDRYHQA